ncbi:enoyl-[acyl-carrier-protein] reductase FabK [Aerococcus loyolae]|uniref:Probable nitronate monooxygenase n=1 Tax=Aerococcus urinae TaxID=1376 RepID=A0A2I1L690_9LACT|nr:MULTISPECIES: nitronate monooxygenase [Aerococcus]MCY3067767.1 nitronate monooxygenase family protein [Aerococcus mictus]MCY3080333.1 nitronate monooxygenase family protein [Aerococcus mictus]MDK6728006.1 nitronate monooxygenase [Aerococcus urinae]MDK7909360.1 nitronate monooxygenase [Aerococcus urinae]MDK8609661.1 nitronate monooxygenase [Aerococcus urinae]
MNRVCELLNIEYPIIQGSMAGVAEAPLAGAVSEAGGLGVIATAGRKGDWLREQIKAVREITDKPFAVNLMLMSHNTEEIMEVIIDEGIQVVTTGAGNAAPLIAPLHEAGVKVVPVVANARQAKKMEDAGADAVVCEGTEAGGHVGEVTTMPLARAVIAAVDIPVIIAGGIADGHGLAAAFALGGEGAQLGTVFCASEEAPIAQGYKEAIVNCGLTDTVVVGRSIGAPVRLIQNDMVAKLQEEIDNGSSRDEFEKSNLQMLLTAITKGDTEKGIVTIGQVAGNITAIRPVKEIIDSIVEEACQALNNMPSI